ncbi:LOW QUALITY PROTEIN: shugoshin 1 [Menidia menidia]
MARERAQKKSFQESLEDIKERMKERRNKRLASAAAPSMGRRRMTNKISGTNTTHTILKGVQLNNKALAVALQSEKEKVRQANAVILQLKREQQALFLHLLLFKKKLKEREALAGCSAETKTADGQAEAKPPPDSSRGEKTSQSLKPDAGHLSPASPDSAANAEYCLLGRSLVCSLSVILSRLCCLDHPLRKRSRDLRNAALPSTVGQRRRPADRASRRRSGRVQEQRPLGEEAPASGFGPAAPSPILSDAKRPGGSPGGAEPEPDPVHTEEVCHSTPEPAPPRRRQQQPAKRQAQQRAPLKKPWENPKPRARSKSRERSATRARAAPPPPPGGKLNTSLGSNDTFDFDCEEAVHVTPFRAKMEDVQPPPPVCEGGAGAQAPPAAPPGGQTSSSSPSSESEDSLYVPQRSRRRKTSPERPRAVTTRRGRPSRGVRRTGSGPPPPEPTVLRDEAPTPKASEGGADLHGSPAESILSNSPETERLDQEDPRSGPQREEDGLPPVSPLVEAEMMRIDSVLSNFGDSSCEAPSLLRHQTPQRLKTCTKRGLGVRRGGRGLSLCDVTNLSPAAYRSLSDARGSAPSGPAPKRRCTMAVDYKEPSLNAKLRRGDKFTDVQFLRSPIFKQKPGRRSVQKSRSSVGGQQPFEKYNESFVGCR